MCVGPGGMKGVFDKSMFGVGCGRLGFSAQIAFYSVVRNLYLLSVCVCVR